MTRMTGVWAAAVVVNLVWATTFVSTQVLLRVFSPFEIQFMRYLLAWAVLWMVRPSACGVKSKGDLCVFLGMGGVGVAFYQVLENYAVGCLDAAATGVLMSLGPLLSVCALEVVRRRRRPSWRFVAGTGIACSGAALACCGGTTEMSFSLKGTTAAFGAMFCWSVYAVGSEVLANRGYDAVLIARGAFFWAVVLSLPIVCLKLVSAECAPGSDGACSWLSRFDGKVVFNLALLGVGASAVCYALWEWIGVNGGYGQAVVLLYLSPICTVLVSWLAFDRTVPPEEWAGAAFSVAGVAWALSGRQPVGKVILDHGGIHFRPRRKAF